MARMSIQSAPAPSTVNPPVATFRTPTTQHNRPQVFTWAVRRAQASSLSGTEVLALWAEYTGPFMSSPAQSGAPWSSLTCGDEKWGPRSKPLIG